MRIAEIFSSRQGEGRLTGTPSVFVRASGCNLRCWFCDTPYASWQPEGDDLSLDDILDDVTRHGLRHVVLTGGEPMLFAELVPLTQRLRAAGQHVTIETAGTLDLPVECDLMSLSPKRANSRPPADREPLWAVRHERSRHAPAVIRRLMGGYDYQLKFVIDQPADIADVEQYLAEFPEVAADRVWLMPLGITPGELAERTGWLEPVCAERGWHFCPRRQIEWFGLTRGT